MITEERLKALIEKEATIYSTADYHEVINADKYKICDNYVLIKKCKCGIDFDKLYETKSEAEFQTKYGNVEKTVKMPVPPTYEEFKKKKAYAFKKDEDVFLLKQDRYDGNDMFIIDKITFGEHKNIKTWHFVEDFKTIYYKALDKMVELWREEV